MARRRFSPRPGSTAMVWAVMGSTLALGVLAFLGWTVHKDPDLLWKITHPDGEPNPRTLAEDPGDGPKSSVSAVVTQPLLVGGVYRASAKSLPVFRGRDPGSLKPAEYHGLREKPDRIMTVLERGEFRVMRISDGHREGHWFYLVAVAADSLRESIDGYAVERWLDGDALTDAGLTELEPR